ncbi:MAG: hypothetical protein NC416_17185 [Eubacterium sp.]|nr:hypothetical protein [Eubacterium sp.]
MMSEKRERRKGIKHRKVAATVLLLLSMFFLVGFGNKKVALFKDNKDYKLIDLDKAIENAAYGKSGNTSALREEKEDSATKKEVAGKEAAEQEQVKEEKTETYQIIISGEKIKFGNMECKTIADLKKAITEYCTKGTNVFIVDDYADYRTYQEVLELVEEMSKTQGFAVEQE